MRLDGGGTVAGPGTWEAALAAAGTSIAAVERVLSGAGDVAYALVRPPGHHAQPDKADGSCIFNNIGIATLFALQQGIERIAIIDWDQHHGNGTQEGFYTDDRVLTVSVHMPHGRWGQNHSQRGTIDEVGSGRGVGYNLNVEVPFGAGDRCYQEVMAGGVAPVMERYQPELLIVANGQDANQFDPNGRSLLTMEGFRSLGRWIKEQASKHTNGRLILVQEGGYATSYTAFCAYAAIEGLLDFTPRIPDPMAYYDQSRAATIPDMEALLEHWQSLVRLVLE